jgi:hypothetical protein
LIIEHKNNRDDSNIDLNNNDVNVNAPTHLDDTIKLQTGNTPLDEYNPSLFHLLMPALFPYEDYTIEGTARPTSIGYNSHVKHLLNCANRRFATHQSFMFIAFNVMQRRTVSMSARSYTHRVNFSHVTALIAKITPAIIDRNIKALQNKMPLDDNIKEVINVMDTMGKKVLGSKAARKDDRKNTYALFHKFGGPTFFHTINFAEMYSSLALHFAGLDVDPTLDNPNYADFPKSKERYSAITLNPVASAKCFHKYLKEYLKIIQPNDGSIGILGNVQAYNAMVESNGHAGLHCHMLIWIKGAIPNPDKLIEAMLENVDIKNKVVSFMENTISNDVQYGPEVPDHNRQIDLHPSTRRYIFIIFRFPVPPHFDELSFNNLIQKEAKTVAKEAQNHICYSRGTCYKYDEKKCRFHAPWKLKEASSFDEVTGIIHLKRSVDERINKYSKVSSAIARCNNDISMMLSSAESKAAMIYSTDYSTKDSLPMTTCLEMIKKGFLTLRPVNERSINETTRLQLIRCFTCIQSQQELTSTEVSSLLNELPLSYSSHKFRSLHLEIFITYINNPTDETFAIKRNRFGQEEYTTYVNQRQDYTFRGMDLNLCSLYDMIQSYQKLSMREKSLSNIIKFSNNHPEYISHGHKRSVSIVQIAYSIPSKNNKLKTELYSMIMLILFKCWRSKSDLIEHYKSWNEAFSNFYVNPEHQHVIDCIQLLHDAKQSRNEHVIERNNNSLEEEDDIYNQHIDNLENAELGSECSSENQTVDDISTIFDTVFLQNQLNDLPDYTTNYQFTTTEANTNPNTSQYSFIDFPPDMEKNWAEKWWKNLPKDPETIFNADHPIEIIPSMESLPSWCPIATSSAIEIQNTVSKQFTLNKEQCMVFDFLCHHHHTVKTQCILYLRGPGGAGKSWAMAAFKEYLTRTNSIDMYCGGAFTGIASANIKLPTINSWIRTGLKWFEEPSESTKKLLELDLAKKQFGFIDEITQVALGLLGRASANLNIGKNLPYGIMGGLNMTFAGDLEQFDPVSHPPFYGNPRYGALATVEACGKLVYEGITHCIDLHQTPRFEGEYNGFMSRLYNYTTTDEDIEQIKSKLLTKNESFKAFDAILLTARNKNRIQWNVAITKMKISSSTCPIYQFKSRDKFKKTVLKDAAADYFHQFEAENKYPGILDIWVGMHIMVTSTKYRLYEVTYGTFGNIEYVYTSPNGIPNCIIIYIPTFQGKLGIMILKLDHLPRGCLPFFPETFSTKFSGFKGRGGIRKYKSISRYQFGFQQAYAITDYKSQSKTFKKTIIDIEPQTKNFKSESLYTMFSRNKNWDNLRLLSSFNEKNEPIFKPEWLSGRKVQTKILEPTNNLNILAAKTMQMFTGLNGNPAEIVSSFTE